MVKLSETSLSAEASALLAAFSLPAEIQEYVSATIAAQMMGYTRQWVLKLVHRKALLARRTGYGKGKFQISTISILRYMRDNHVR